MKMTPLVKTSLIALRIYLLILLTLIIVSFARVLKSGKSETVPAASRRTPSTQPLGPTAVPSKKKHGEQPPS
jgi:hypothetical protein